MTARSADDALAALFGRVRSVAGCITRRPIITITERAPVHIVRLSFGPASQPVALRTPSQRSRVYLSIAEENVIDRASGSSSVERRAYYYRILDRDDREILAYHWHPMGRSAIGPPHLHLSNQIRPVDTGRGSAAIALADLHLATGAMTLTDVVWMLIDEFEVISIVEAWWDVLGLAQDG